jgi:transposase
VTANEQAAEIAKLRAQLAERDALLADRDATIAELREQVAELTRMVKGLVASRGRGSHLIAEGQGVLFDDPDDAPGSDVEPDREPEAEDEPQAEADAPTEAEDASPPKPKKGKRKIDTSALAREDRLHELPESERVCPVTGALLVAVGEKVFEEIDHRRAHFVLIRHRHVVYGLPPEVAEERQIEPVVTPLPPRAIEGCIASASLIAWLMVQKFANHLPLYRQEKICERDGLRIARQTLCDWQLRGAEALAPLVDCMLGKIRAGPVMQLDDTPVKCQAGKGQPNYQAYLWTFVNPEVGSVVYRFTPGRAGELIAREIGDFSGYLVGDGYSGNGAGAKAAPGEIQLAGCWAHTIRKFRDARSESAKVAKLFESDIRQLYRIEKEADKDGLDDAQRLALRKAKSDPVLADSLFPRAERMLDDFGESGDMGKAINYLLNQREPLSRFLEDARIPLDNNSCERAIRPIAIGRRNWLFAGSERGGRAAAIAYSIIESCRRAAVDPQAYIADVLVRVASHPMSRIEELLPAAWAASYGAGTARAEDRRQ